MPGRSDVLRNRLQVEVFPEAGYDFFCPERDTPRLHASQVAWKETMASPAETLAQGFSPAPVTGKARRTS